MPAKKNKGGRPSSYNKKVAAKLCSELAQGKSLRTVCKISGMPTVKTVFNWFDKYPEFLQQYERAKQESADALVDEIIDIADNGTNDWMEKNAGEDDGYRYNGEHVQRSRLRVDSRKWIAAKLKPKKYGDNKQIDLTLNTEQKAQAEIKKMDKDQAEQVLKLIQDGESLVNAVKQVIGDE